MTVDDPDPVESMTVDEPDPAEPSVGHASWPSDKKAKFDDQLKLELVMAYAEYAENPFVRDESASGRVLVRV